MLSKRLAAVIGIVAVCAMSMTGCGNKGNDMVDAPLIKNAAPPPEKPNKPDLKPTMGGGPG